MTAHMLTCIVTHGVMSGAGTGWYPCIKLTGVDSVTVHVLPGVLSGNAKSVQKRQKLLQPTFGELLRMI